MSKISTQPYKGTRDFYPQDFRLREYIFGKWREVCQSFGYEEYEASVIEPLELYTAKTSEEIVKEQTFSFQDRGGRDVTLRPEMTPTVSRMVAARRMELGYPLRLFSIPNCFRYERMQRGRTREFWQLNLDMFGVAGVEAEVEIMLASYRLLKSFGATEDMFEIRINSRKLLNEIIDKAGPKNEPQEVVRLIDAFDKLSSEEFSDKLSALVEDTGVVQEFLEGNTTNEDIDILLDRAKKAGINNVRFVPSIARGFDYYTDIVFEVFDLDPENNRAMFGGGRYDGLVGMFGVELVPTIGIAVGDVTMQNFLESHDLIPKLSTKNDMYIMVSDDQFEQAQEYAQQQRKAGKNVAVDLSGKKIDKQFKTAKKLGFTSEQIIKFPISPEFN
ncbi:histidine--tRNA ligase [Candidatus Saccharibacteria bacterium]|nr:histidine--tRNA ligase [Candidatus Saccharibacteria bacterium]